MWIWFGIFPSSVPHDSPSWIVAFGVANCALFVLLMLFLNFESLLFIIGLVNFIGLWMMFLDPGYDTFANGFTPCLLGAPVAGLIVAVIGVKRAIIVSMVPYPYWAMDKAPATARGIAKEPSEMWTAVVDFYCAETTQTYETSQVSKNMRGLADMVNGLSCEVATGWWECFQMARWQKARAMLKIINRTAKENYDRLTSCLAVCMLKSYEPGSSRMAFDDEDEASFKKCCRRSNSHSTASLWDAIARDPSKTALSWAIRAK